MVGLALNGSRATTWAQYGLTLAFTCIYDLTLGLYYVLLAEVCLPDCVVPRWSCRP